MRKVAMTILGISTSLLLIPEQAEAQRRGERNRSGANVGRIIQQFTSPNRRNGFNNRSISRNLNRSRTLNNRNDLGRNIVNQIVGNQIRNGISDALGVPRNNRNVRGLDNRRGRNSGVLNNSILRDNRRFDDRIRRSGSSNRLRNGLIAGAILSQFPRASGIVTPRSQRQSGAFYRNNGNYYYYPNVASQSYVTTNPRSNVVSSSTIQQTPASSVRSQQMVTGTVNQTEAPEPVEMKHGGWVYAGQLSQILPVVTNTLCLDMHYNYRQAENFDDAYRNAYAMLQNAKLLSSAHEEGDRGKIKALAMTIDRLQHRVEEQTEGWVRQETKQIGELGLMTKLETTDAVIHHLLHDIGVSKEDHDRNTGEAAPTLAEPDESEDETQSGEDSDYAPSPTS